MNSANFSLEFELNVSEIRKLNKMYFKHLYKERGMIFSCFAMFCIIFFDFIYEEDFTTWIVKDLVIIVLFFSFQYPIINTICKLIFQLTGKLSKFERFVRKYKLNFTNSSIYVHSPLGEFAHKWSKIEKAILTKDFFFLYVKDKNGYIISISNKGDTDRNMNKLLSFIESNVTPITKV